MKYYATEEIDLAGVSELFDIPEEDLLSFREAHVAALQRLQDAPESTPSEEKLERDERVVLEAIQRLKNLIMWVIQKETSFHYNKVRKILLKHDLHPKCKSDGSPFKEKPFPEAMIVRKGSAEEALQRDPDSFDPDYVRARMKVLGAIIEHDAISIVQIEKATGLSREVIEEVMVCEDLFEVVLRQSRNFDLERILFHEQVITHLAHELIDEMNSHQAVCSYLETRGLDEYYRLVRARLNFRIKEAKRRFQKKKVKEAREKHEMRDGLLSLLVQRGLDLTEDPDEQDVLKLRRMGEMNAFTWEQLVQVFRGHFAGYGVHKTARIAKLGPKEQQAALALRVYRAWTMVGRSTHHEWPAERSRIPDEQIEVMRHLRSGAVPIAEIARRLGVSESTVERMTEGYGVVEQSKVVTPEEAARMNLLRWGEEDDGKAKMTIEEVAEIMGRAPQTVFRHTRRD